MAMTLTVNGSLSLVTFLVFILLPDEHAMLLLIFDAAWLTLMSIVITRMVFHLRAYVSTPSGQHIVTAASRISAATTVVVSQPIAFKSWEAEETGTISDESHGV